MFRYLRNVQVKLDVPSPVAVGGVLFVAALTKGGHAGWAIGRVLALYVLCILYVAIRNSMRRRGRIASNRLAPSALVATTPEQETTMPNPGSANDPARRQRATWSGGSSAHCAARRISGCRSTACLAPELETAVRDFQEGAGLVVDGIVGPVTWNALPDGGSHAGSTSKAPPARSFARCRLCSPMALPVHGTSTPHGHRRQFRSAHEGFRAGVPDLGRRCSRTEWWETRPGRSPCTQRAPPWKVWLASNSL